MNILEAKEQVESTIRAYLAKDADGIYAIPPSRQRPVFLIGAPGIGKTAIMEQIAAELGIGLVSYSMTHHTRQSALGLPMIVHESFDGFEYSASEYTMSEIIASVYEHMRRTGLRRGILFLDEINCVSETLYPSMLQFLQFKTFGKHRVPDDWVVVCAGNPPEYNKSVHEFDIVTLDRLRKVEVEPDYAAWRRYAQDTGVHPAIITYLEARKEDFYSVESKPGSKSFVTARGWSDLSEVIVQFEKQGTPVNRNLVSQFLQDGPIAERFALYYDLFNKYRSDYQVERILAGEAPAEIVERGRAAEFDERIAIIGLVLDALDTQMRGVTEEEDVLLAVRDELRGAKPRILAGEAAQPTLGEGIARHEEQLARLEARGGAAAGQIRTERRTVELLKELASLCAFGRASKGEPAFALINEAFQGRVSAMNARAAEVEGQLANAYRYVDDAFGTDREALAFTAELTARRATSRFINRFGSDSYFRHNDGVMVDRHRQELFERIDAAGIGGEAAPAEPTPGQAAKPADKPAAAETPGPATASAPGVAPETVPLQPADIAAYYAQSQFEYGLPSLCKMTLPPDLAGKTVLDIGCRRGRGVYKLSARVGDTGHVIGVEWAPAFVEEAASGAERAWHDSGLSGNNMEFHQGYPEQLDALGIEDGSIDLVYVNTVSNLAFDIEAAFREMRRVLKPGGTLVCETVLASGERDPEVVRAARAIGNSVQAAPSRPEFEGMLARAGFSSVSYRDQHPVAPSDGALPQRPVEAVRSDEDVEFTALVATITR